MMLPKLTDPRPMVRTITCWAVFRYSSWMLEWAVSVSAAAVAPLLSSSVQGILHCVKDHNRFVQHAALTSIATVVEEAVNVDQVSQLTPFLKVCDQISSFIHPSSCVIAYRIHTSLFAVILFYPIR